MVSAFSADEKALRKFLEESAVDWSSPYIVAGEQCRGTFLVHVLWFATLTQGIFAVF